MQNKICFPLISVIIPIYNVASYLRECLDSVISQSYRDLQIILVNDGSTDESESIAREYLNDSRVELVNVANGGLSYARNIGLDKARGEYIYFIDSDDYIHQDFILELVELAQKHKVEFVCSGSILRFYEKPKIQNSDILRSGVFWMDKQKIVLGGAVCRCLFARSLIERSGVRFLEGKVHEDEGFLYMILPFVSRYVACNGVPYYYRQRQESIMNRCKMHRNYDYIDIFKEVYLFYQTNDLLDKFNPPYRFVLDCAIRYGNEREYKKRSKQVIQELGITIPIKERVVGFLKFIKSRLRYYGLIK